MGTAIIGMLDDVDQARADLYRFLGKTLAGPPDAVLIAALARLAGGAGAIGDALRAIADCAATMSPAAAADEYNALFIGVARGELVPYASFYVTGFLYDRPLARLREDMARHGLVAADDRSDPEDHIATVLEIIAGLIDGAHGEPLPVADQHAFFRRHLEPWAGRFFTDLEHAGAARLYRPIGTLGRTLMAIESDAFLLEVA